MEDLGLVRFELPPLPKVPTVGWAEEDLVVVVPRRPGRNLLKKGFTAGAEPQIILIDASTLGGLLVMFAVIKGRGSYIDHRDRSRAAPNFAR